MLSVASCLVVLIPVCTYHLKRCDNCCTMVSNTEAEQSLLELPCMYFQPTSAMPSFSLHACRRLSPLCSWAYLVELDRSSGPFFGLGLAPKDDRFARGVRQSRGGGMEREGLAAVPVTTVWSVQHLDGERSVVDTPHPGWEHCSRIPFERDQVRPQLKACRPVQDNG